MPNLPVPDRSQSTNEQHWPTVHSIGGILHPLRRKWPVSGKTRQHQMALASLVGEYTGLVPKNPNDATRTDPGYRTPTPQHSRSRRGGNRFAAEYGLFLQHEGLRAQARRGRYHAGGSVPFSGPPGQNSGPASA